MNRWELDVRGGRSLEGIARFTCHKQNPSSGPLVNHNTKKPVMHKKALPKSPFSSVFVS